jgi:hypothetical protein
MLSWDWLARSSEAGSSVYSDFSTTGNILYDILVALVGAGALVWLVNLFAGRGRLASRPSEHTV